MKIAELKAALEDTKDQIRHILASAKTLGRDLSDEELQKIDELKAEAEKTQADLKAAEERAARISAAAAFAEPEPVTPPLTAGTNAGTPVVTHVHQRSEDDPQAGFAHGGQFLLAVRDHEMSRGAVMDERLAPLHAAVGSDEQRSNSNPLGGFLVPEGFSPNLLSITPESDPTAGLVASIPMQTPSLSIPARVDKDHSSSVTGGWQFYYGSQAHTLTSSKGTFEQVKLGANTKTALAYVTNEQMQDSAISMTAILESAFSDENASFTLDKRINGTGVGEPEGLLNAAAKVAQAKETSQTADTINGTNIVKMRSRCYGYGRAIWLANHDTYPQLAAAHIAGTNGDVSVWQESLGADRPSLLLGRPVYFSEYCKTLGDEGDLILVDLSQYLYGVLMGAEMTSSVHVRFESNEQAFKVTARDDGRCWWRSALMPKESSTALSPIVTLAARD